MGRFPTELNPDPYPILHLVRHGHIPNYLADQPLTRKGQRESFDVGRDLADQIRQGEIVSIFSSPSRRARQTAEFLRKGLCERLTQIKTTVTGISNVVVDDRLLSCQIYMDGLSYDPMEPLTEVSLWRLQQTRSVENETSATYLKEFWRSGDPMGYWLTHSSKVIESPDATLERICNYIAERTIMESKAGEMRRDVCVTHSGNLRVLGMLVFGRDSGDPPYCETLTVSGGLLYYAGQHGNFAFLG